MKVALLGAYWSLSAEPMDQTVVPPVGLPAASAQVKDVPPQSWTSIPRCFLYQARNVAACLALKKMPPIPVTRFMESPIHCGDCPHRHSVGPDADLNTNPLYSPSPSRLKF